MEATLLLCPRCRVAVPVRKRLLLVLPEGDKFEYDERMQAMPRGGPSAARWRRERCDTMRRVP